MQTLIEDRMASPNDFGLFRVLLSVRWHAERQVPQLGPALMRRRTRGFGEKKARKVATFLEGEV